MFACSLYPTLEDDFINSVKEEINQNIKRLQKHPCIALWCGNNEVDVAWHNWGWQHQFGYNSEDSTIIWKGHIELFENIIPDIIQGLDNRPYIPSSPQSNWGTEENFNHGCMHYWDVWHGKKDIDVPWQTSFDLALKIKSTNVKNILIERGTHRLSTKNDLNVLTSSLDELYEGFPQKKN